MFNNNINKKLKRVSHAFGLLKIALFGIKIAM